MQPGYRKKTKFISTSRNNTGFVTMNNVVDQIKEMTSSEEFYEIEPAIVLKVYMDDQAADFPTKTYNNAKVPNYEMMGAIRVRLLYSQNSGEYLEELVKHLSLHIVQYPVRGEIVNVANYNGKLYYSNPLNRFGLVNMNRGSSQLSDNTVMFKYTKYNRSVAPEQGDTVFQGRYGQSLHFGSDKNYVKPYIKLSVGQGQVPAKEKVQWDRYPHITGINLDEASIHIMTNQHIPLKTAAPSKVKHFELGGYNRSAIAMNADSIALNAKDEVGDISMFANRFVNIAANTQINLETELGKIYLGDVDTNNRVVKSEELKLLLDNLLTQLISFSKAILPKRNQTEESKAAIDKIVIALNKIKEDDLGEIPSFASNRVFIANELDEEIKKSQEGIYSEKDWPWQDFPVDTEFEEITDVTDENYETETRSSTTGVRG